MAKKPRSRAAKRTWPGAALHVLRPKGPWLYAGLSSLVVAVLPRLESHLWLGALAAEAHVQLSLITASLALVCGARRQYLALLLATASTLGLVLPLAGLLRPSRPTPEKGPTLRVMHAHFAGVASPSSAIMTWLRSDPPDVVALTGLRPEDAQALVRQLGNPFRVPNSSPIGGVHTRREGQRVSALLTRGAVPKRRAPAGSALSAWLSRGRCDVRIAVVDLPDLAQFDALNARRRLLESYGQAREPARSIWLGHLGSRSEASDVAAFLAQGELRDTRRGHGRLATAPGVLGPLGFPVDHVLVHGWLGVRERSNEDPPVPGAHRAVRATLELTEPRCR